MEANARCERICTAATLRSMYSVLEDQQRRGQPRRPAYTSADFTRRSSAISLQVINSGRNVQHQTAESTSVARRNANHGTAASVSIIKCTRVRAPDRQLCDEDYPVFSRQHARKQSVAIGRHLRRVSTKGLQRAFKT